MPSAADANEAMLRLEVQTNKNLCQQVHGHTLPGMTFRDSTLALVEEACPDVTETERAS